MHPRYQAILSILLVSATLVVSWSAPATNTGTGIGTAKGTARPVATSAKVSESLTVAGWSYQLDSDELEKAWSWRTGLEATGPFESRFVIHYKSPQDYTVLRVAGDAKQAQMGFWRVANGRAQKLGEPTATIVAPRGQLTLQRSAWRVRALWNGRALVSAFSSVSGAQFGRATRGAVKLKDARMQPIEAPVFEDDFMRAQGPDDPEKPGEWHRVAGVWKTSGLISPRANASLNPNPFVFRAEVPGGGNGSAVATVGKWFWSDYAATVSVRPTVRSLKHPLVAGVAAYHQANGTSVLGVVDFRTGRASLRVGNRILATSAPFRASLDQWHRLYLEPGPGTLRLIVDGVERVRASSSAAFANGTLPPTLAQGEAALYADLGGGNYADFDDVRIGANDAISDDFRTPAVGRWEDVTGQWQHQQLKLGSNPQFRLKANAGPGLTLTGSAEREAGRVEASFINLQNATAQPSFGVAFAARDNRNYMLARLRTGLLEIVDYSNGTGKILASGKALKVPKPSALAVEWSEGVITARAVGTQVTAVMATVPAGRVGVWADGPKGAAGVTSFLAMGAAPRWGEGALPERFQKDNLMANWASNAKAWKLSTEGTKSSASGTWWHTGDFFQDVTLDLPLPTLTPATDMTLLLGADPAQTNIGAKLVVGRAGNGLEFKLSEGGQSVKTVTLDNAAAKPHQLRFVRRPVGDGRVILRVAVDGRIVLAETTPATDSAATNRSGQGTKAGVRFARAQALDWEKVTAATTHALDYTFTSAPVDWESNAGRWDVSERWTCSPQWAFFAGGEAVNPTLWSRFAMRGDFTLEAYLATPMDQTRGERSPVDLNLSVGGDGRNLASGYSFLFAANERKVNRVLRGDDIVVDKPFVRPPSRGNDHQDWFYVRVERRQTPQGLRLRYFVNGQTVADYTDPSPLKSALHAGRVAFWTYNGGLSIARVRLWHSGIEGATDSSFKQPGNTGVVTASASTSTGLKNALGEWSPRHEGLLETTSRLQMVNAGNRRAVQITNAQSGGDWTVYITRQPFDAAQHPRLRFDYRLPVGVRVNLYAKVDGRWREIIFSGDAAQLPKMRGTLYGRPRVAAARRVPMPATPQGRPTAEGAITAGPTVPAEVDTSLTIGTIANVVIDNQWHTANFDLLSALRAANLGTSVEALAFAAPNRDYLWVGLGGNHLGATYWLSDFQAISSNRPSVAAVPTK